MGLIVVLGLCLMFTPLIILIGYIITKSRKKRKFDEYINYLKKTKGSLAVFIAYASKFFIGTTITLLGFYMSEELDNEIALKYLIVSLILAIITCYFDKKNKR